MPFNHRKLTVCFTVQNLFSARSGPGGLQWEKLRGFGRTADRVETACFCRICRVASLPLESPTQCKSKLWPRQELGCRWRLPCSRHPSERTAQKESTGRRQFSNRVKHSGYI